MDEWFEKLKSDPEIGIAYRYCRCREADPGWLSWMNREPQINQFIKRLEAERADLNVIRIQDDRQTEFFVISRRGNGSGPDGRSSTRDVQPLK